MNIRPRRTLDFVFASFVLAVCLSLADMASAVAQGGGNANAVGSSLEAAAQSAAANPRAGGAPAAAATSGPPAGMSTSGPPANPGDQGGSYGSPDSSSYGPPDSSSYDPSSGYDGGYGGDPGYGSAARGGDQLQRSQVAIMMASQQLAQTIAGFFSAAPGEAELEARHKTLWEQAALTFYRGDQRRALALYHAHLIADGEAASEARAAVMYSRLLKRPVWLIRFGLSIHPRVPSELADDPQPLREDTKITLANPRGRGNVGGPEESYSGPPNDTSSSDPSAAMGPESSGEFAGSGFDGRAAKPVVMTLGGDATAQVKATVDRNLGLLADVTSELFGSLFKAGKFGRAFDLMEAKGAELAALSQSIGDEAPSDLPMWIPGVDFVGTGAYTEMLAKAKASEIDILMHFDVIVKENRVGPPQYTTRCRLFHVDSGDTIVISKAIDKYEIASKGDRNRELVHEIMAAMFDIADKKVSVEPMPALRPEHAVARIDTLLASKKPDSLRNLAEMVMFRSRDLVTPEQLDKALYYAGDDAALQLFHDQELQRYERATKAIDQELVVKLSE